MNKRTKEPPSWVQLQHKTMIRWVNKKLTEESTSDTPKLANSPAQLTSFNDLQDGLILIRLVNQLICEVIANPKHSMNRTQLYYLKPLYPKPTFKIQKIENINDFLQFVKIILNINVSGISADNIFEGDLKLILGFIWQLFLFDSSASFVSISSTAPSLVEIKSILKNWMNNIVSKRQLEVTNFNKDWSIEINRPDIIFSHILQHYGLSIASFDPHKKIQNLTTIVEYSEKTLGIPHLVDIEDFTLLVPDEKCIVTYLIEWFKVFEINKSYTNALIPQEEEQVEEEDSNRYDELVVLLISTVKLKNKYETKALRFLNRANQVISSLSHDCTDMNFLSGSNGILPELQRFLLSAKSQEINNYKTFSSLNSKFESLLTLFEAFSKLRISSVPDLIYQGYPEMLQYLYLVKNNLEEVDILYIPTIKQLSLENLSMKLSSLIELDSSMLSHCKELLKKLSTALKPISSLEKSDEVKQLVYMQNQLLHYSTEFEQEIELEKFNDLESPKKHNDKFSMDSTDLKRFCSHFKSHENYITHFELQKFLKTSIFTTELKATTLDSFIKLIPVKSKSTMTSSLPSSTSSNSINDPDFKLSPPCNLPSTPTDSVHVGETASSNSSFSSTSSDEDDFLFDEVQQRLDSQLSGTSDKVYDIHEFVSKLQNGFSLSS